MVSAQVYSWRIETIKLRLKISKIHKRFVRSSIRTGVDVIPIGSLKKPWPNQSSVKWWTFRNFQTRLSNVFCFLCQSLRRWLWINRSAFYSPPRLTNVQTSVFRPKINCNKNYYILIFHNSAPHNTWIFEWLNFQAFRSFFKTFSRIL